MIPTSETVPAGGRVRATFAADRKFGAAVLVPFYSPDPHAAARRVFDSLATRAPSAFPVSQPEVVGQTFLLDLRMRAPVAAFALREQLDTVDPAVRVVDLVRIDAGDLGSQSAADRSAAAGAAEQGRAVEAAQRSLFGRLAQLVRVVRGVLVVVILVASGWYFWPWIARAVGSRAVRARRRAA